MIIELRSGDKKAIVDTKGGYLTNYADENGDIIYPKRMLTAPNGEEKTRGGCHVCLPNFGPGGDSGLDQHGYGRTSAWDITETGDTHVALRLAGQGEYADMESVLRYDVGDTGLTMALTVTNNGAHDLTVGPAFHPYFATGDHLAIDGEAYDMDAFNEMVLSDATDERVVTTNGHALVLKSADLPYWAHWSDRLAGYFCIEPSFGGFTFVPENHRRRDTLAPQQSKTYTFTIA